MGKLSDPLDTSLIQMKHRTLELQEYASLVDLGTTAIQSMRVERSEDIATRHLIERISMSILRDKIADDSYKARYRYSVYDSWWQHFKADVMPAWFVKRYPAKKTQKSGYVTVSFTRYAEYPKANIPIQSDKRMYEIMLGGTEIIKDFVQQS